MRRAIPLVILFVLQAVLVVQPPSDLHEESVVAHASGRAVATSLLTDVTSPSDIAVQEVDAHPSGWVIGGTAADSVSIGGTTITGSSSDQATVWLFLVDEDGVVIWDLRIDQGGSSGVAILTDMVVDSQGSTYVTGRFLGTIGFGSTQLSASAPIGEGFLAKVDASGTWTWALGFQTSGTSNLRGSWPTAIDVTPNGGVAITGLYNGSLDVGGVVLSGRALDVFASVYDGNGNLQVANSGGSGQDAIPNDLTVDPSGNVHIVGYSTSAPLFGSRTFVGYGSAEGFVVTMSSSGEWTRLIPFRGAGTDGADLISSDAQGNLIVAGATNQWVSLGQFNVSARYGGFDLVIAGLSSSGTWTWAELGGSSFDDGWSALDVRSSGDVVLAGSAGRGGLTYDGTTISSGNADNDTVLLGISIGTGSLAWSERIGTSEEDITGDVAVNGTDDLMVVGGFDGTLTRGTSSITSTGTDGYLWLIDGSTTADSDGDDVPDELDNCPSTSNPVQLDTDGDGLGDACDPDDDEDGVTDNNGDLCPRDGAVGWASTQDLLDPSNSTDWDRDGCRDADEDPDIDNDGVPNAVDRCPRTSYPPPRPTWVSSPENDLDLDGCRDVDEDTDDDQDGFVDALDTCPTVVGTSNRLDVDGCPDDDFDGFANQIDDCPQVAGSSTTDAIGCPDEDGDGWPDDSDAFVSDPTQWSDRDADGFGDALNGTRGDACPDEPGASTEDRFGCPDRDGDGFSDPSAAWGPELGGDVFPDDLTQWNDTDEDGFGDNFDATRLELRTGGEPGRFIRFATRPDDCPLVPGTSTEDDVLGCPDADDDGWADRIDAFPYDREHHADSDGDGFPDGIDDCFDPDPAVPGNSTIDRQGCPDDDGDGYSFSPYDFTGADRFPTESTQWFDRDGDGYGDELGGFEGDVCPDEFGGSPDPDWLGCPASRVPRPEPEQGASIEDDLSSEVLGIESGVLGLLGAIGAVLLIGVTMLTRRSRPSKSSAVFDASVFSQPIPARGLGPIAPNTSSPPSMIDLTMELPYAAPAVAPPIGAPRRTLSSMAPTPNPYGPSSGPSPDMVGSMRADGNEWLEHPVHSGAWYVREHMTGTWTRRI